QDEWLGEGEGPPAELDRDGRVQGPAVAALQLADRFPGARRRGEGPVPRARGAVAAAGGDVERRRGGGGRPPGGGGQPDEDEPAGTHRAPSLLRAAGSWPQERLRPGRCPSPGIALRGIAGAGPRGEGFSGRTADER